MPPSLFALSSISNFVCVSTLTFQGCLLVQFVHWVVDEVCGRQPDWTKPFGEANAQPMIDAVKLFVIKAVGGGLKKDDVRV